MKFSGGIMDFLACSECFSNQGLKLDAEYLGEPDNSKCHRCDEVCGKKLTRTRLENLVKRFFYDGTFVRCDFGEAPKIIYNSEIQNSISTQKWLEEDITLLCKTLSIGFNYYGPPLWMLGEIEPLVDLRNENTQAKVIDRIIKEFPTVELSSNHVFYRVRKKCENPEAENEYDSPPPEKSGQGRFDSDNFATLYASQDLEVCIHENRINVEDDLFVATISPITTLKLLDLSVVLTKEKGTPFESLGMAITQLFLAGCCSYPITRNIAKFAYDNGFDGIIYPSYFSSKLTGLRVIETAYGLPYRMFDDMEQYENAKIIANLALFGYPIRAGKVEVKCVNKLIVNKIKYDYHFGPVDI